MGGLCDIIGWETRRIGEQTELAAVTKGGATVFRPGPCELQSQNVLCVTGEECGWAREHAGYRVVRGPKGWRACQGGDQTCVIKRKDNKNCNNADP